MSREEIKAGLSDFMVKGRQEGISAGVESDAKQVWPRITLVTAVYNGEKYIEETLRSVLAQEYPNLEYIVVDGGSKDGTVDIIRNYERHLAWWVSEPDHGVYDALNKGFVKSTGEIMGWLNASDLLHTNGLRVVGSVFKALSGVEWITGNATGFSADGMAVEICELQRWSRGRFLAGANKYVQQESTFWRRRLWDQAGARVESNYRDVGDFDLWVRFFRYAQLYTVDALIGGYRFHEDAITAKGRDEYDRRCDEIVESELASLPGASAVKMFRSVGRVAQRIPKMRGFWNKYMMKWIYEVPSASWPPVVEYKGGEWAFRK